MEHVGEPSLPGVPLYLPPLPSQAGMGKSCCGCSFIVPTLSIPKGTVYQSVKVVSLLTMCRSYFHSSVEFKDTRSFPLTPVLLNNWKYPSAGLSNADNTHSGVELVTGCLYSALPYSEFPCQQCASVSFSAFLTGSVACQIG